MIISYAPDGTIIAKAKNATIALGGSVKIDSYTVPGAGEYDIAQVTCQVSSLNQSMLYSLHTEDLSLAFLSDLETEIVKDDQASSIDILAIELRSDAAPENIKTILKAVEPSYLFLSGAGATDELFEKLSLPRLESNQLKITRAGLPLEGTFLVVA